MGGLVNIVEYTPFGKVILRRINEGLFGLIELVFDDYYFVIDFRPIHNYNGYISGRDFYLLMRDEDNYTLFCWGVVTPFSDGEVLVDDEDISADLRRQISIAYWIFSTQNKFRIFAERLWQAISKDRHQRCLAK